MHAGDFQRRLLLLLLYAAEYSAAFHCPRRQLFFS